MYKKICPLIFLASVLFSLLFLSCGIGEIITADVPTIRKNIKLTYEFTDSGCTYSWTTPNHLDSHAIRFCLSDNDSDSLTGSSSYGTFYCKKIPAQYRHPDYGDEVSINASCTSINFNYRFEGITLYLWVQIENTFYNLGQFTSTETAIEPIKKYIKLNVDTTDLNNLKFQWAIPDYLSINPMCFLLSTDANTFYSPDHEFYCLSVDSKYQETCYGDGVSIKRNCYKVSNGYKLYEVSASSVSPSDYYLWIQIETGYWYNLGKFETPPIQTSGSMDDLPEKTR